MQKRVVRVKDLLDEGDEGGGDIGLQLGVLHQDGLDGSRQRRLRGRGRRASVAKLLEDGAALSRLGRL